MVQVGVQRKPQAKEKICQLDELHNESDVEQKFIWPMLTEALPRGFGFSSVEIRTKANLRQLVIGKRESAKLYYPDYVILISGLPVAVVEAKPPGDKLDDAYREARCMPWS